MNALALNRDALALVRKHGFILWLTLAPLIFLQIAIALIDHYFKPLALLAQMGSLLLEGIIALGAYWVLLSRLNIGCDFTFKRILVYLIAAVFISVAASIGYVLFVVPGLLVMLLSVFTPLIILLKGEGPIEAISSSVTLMKGYYLKSALVLFPVVILMALANIGLVSLMLGLDFPKWLADGISHFISASLALYIPVLLWVMYQWLQENAPSSEVFAQVNDVILQKSDSP
ncbi:hypothetical protein ACQUQU_00885 [Thalassolituus sp. LLYu03]|uniref:hypothetical protein n=1 Tax=Thalassolituus sp. LLYu03 TaxID=3421656 RepID=UPI003D2751CE